MWTALSALLACKYKKLDRNLWYIALKSELLGDVLRQIIRYYQSYKRQLYRKERQNLCLSYRAVTAEN